MQLYECHTIVIQHCLPIFSSHRKIAYCNFWLELRGRFRMENGDQATLLPTVRWAQRKDTLSLKVELQECQRPNIALKPGSIKFDAKGVGANGARLYSFNLDFFKPIDAESCVHKVTGSCVQIFLTKEGAGEWWPRITSSNKSPHFLKLDFSRWRSESDDESEKKKSEFDPSLFKNMDQTRKIGQDMAKKNINNYLLMYNFAQFLAFGYIFLLCSLRLAIKGTDFFKTCYDECGIFVHYAVMFSAMEVIHPLLGFMRGPWLPPLMQFAGRNFSLLCFWLASDYIKQEWYVTALFLVWSAVEVIRYPHYILQLVKRRSKTILWLRYTAWIPLYPLGFAAEALVYVSAAAVFAEKRMYEFNLSFPFAMTLKLSMLINLYLVTFPIGMFVMLRHMWKMRCRKLGRQRLRAP